MEKIFTDVVLANSDEFLNQIKDIFQKNIALYFIHDERLKRLRSEFVRGCLNIQTSRQKSGLIRFILKKYPDLLNEFMTEKIKEVFLDDVNLAKREKRKRNDGDNEERNDGEKGDRNGGERNGGERNGGERNGGERSDGERNDEEKKRKKPTSFRFTAEQRNRMNESFNENSNIQELDLKSLSEELDVGIPSIKRYFYRLKFLKVKGKKPKITV